MLTRSIIAALVLVFFALQYQLWFSSTGWWSLHRLKQQDLLLRSKNSEAAAANQREQQLITQLKHDPAMTETVARSHLGMVKRGEQYYQIITD